MSVKRSEQYEEWKKNLEKRKSVPCKVCGGSYPPCVMDFDHRNPNTKIGEVSRSFNSSWGASEILKCDLLCACCHRNKEPDTGSGRKRLWIKEIKQNPCADCGGVFSSKQMDFDHCVGVKILPVAKMSGNTWSEILNEIKKCDLVCVNCHRIRTHLRKQGKVAPFKGRVDVSYYTLPEDWRSLVGSMEDQSVSALYGIDTSAVYQYRISQRIPVYKKAETIRWQHLAGTMPDSAVAQIGGVVKSTVGHYRRRNNIPPFKKSSNQRSEA